MIEAKKEGTTLSGIAEQSVRHAANVPVFLAVGLNGPLPFLHESTGVETLSRDQRDIEPRSHRVSVFHRPETLAEWAAEPSSRSICNEPCGSGSQFAKGFGRGVS